MSQPCVRRATFKHKSVNPPNGNSERRNPLNQKGTVRAVSSAAYELGFKPGLWHQALVFKSGAVTSSLINLFNTRVSAKSCEFQTFNVYLTILSP
jgi:hypothetical protein